MSPARQSAGILLYRMAGGTAQVLLVHPGGPYWAKRDLGAWSIPKGEFAPGEDPLTVARREFAEETGGTVTGACRPLAPIVQAGGKRVLAWAVAGDFDPAALVSNTFELEWPPRSGRRREFPEVDRAGWFTLPDARAKLLPAQCAFIDELETLLEAG